MRELTVRVDSQISETTARVRADLFPGPDGIGLLYDEFDERSLHIRICEGDELAAYARLTVGQPGVFATWTNGAADLPAGNDVVDLGRCMVVPQYRRLELFRAICLESLVQAHGQGLRHANGAYVVPSRGRIASTIHDVGLEISGPPVHEVEPQGFRAVIQPMTGVLDEMSRGWAAQRQICDARLSRAGWILRWSQQPVGDQLEALATLRQTARIAYRDEGGDLREVEDLIEDIYARDGVEYLRTASGEEVRLDRLERVDGKPST